MNANSKKLRNNSKKVPLTRDFLVKLKQKAWRRGLWFKCLAHGERKLLDLTISVVERVRSFMLARIVSKLVEKLFEALESRIYRLVRTEGQEMAKKLSEVAQRWGYKAAKSWRKDWGLMQFLVITSLGVKS